LSLTAQQIHLARRPQGMPVPEDFKLVSHNLPELKDGEILVKNISMSVDPYMRPRMVDKDSYVAPFALNAVLEGEAVGVVQESKHPEWRVGDIVLSFKGWRDYYMVSGDMPESLAGSVEDGLRQLMKPPPLDVPPSFFLGVLGTVAFTAYAGLTAIGEIKAGETIFISGAAGGVGHMAGQIAKQMGCRVIGSAGSDEKCTFIKSQCGYDEAFNYKTENLDEAIARYAPEGLDVYFDNVGGPMIDAALNNMKLGGRIVTCGMISDYNNLDGQPHGMRNYFQVIAKELTIKGFTLGSVLHLRDEFLGFVLPLLQSGEIHFEQTNYQGVDQAVNAFIGMLSGKNTGKTLIRISE